MYVVLCETTGFNTIKECSTMYIYSEFGALNHYFGIFTNELNEIFFLCLLLIINCITIHN